MTLKALNEAIELGKQLEEALEAMRIFNRLKAIYTHNQEIGAETYRYGTTSKDELAWVEMEIEKQTAEIERIKANFERAKQRNAAYIDTLQDVGRRNMLQLRFVHCMAWKEVAALVGSSEGAVCRQCYSYIRRCAADT